MAHSTTFRLTDGEMSHLRAGAEKTQRSVSNYCCTIIASTSPRIVPPAPPAGPVPLLLTVRLPDPLWKDVRRRAKAAGTSPARYVRACLALSMRRA